MNKTSKKAGFLNRFFGKSNMHYWNEKEFRISRGIKEGEHMEIPGVQLKKKSNFQVMKKKSCEISMGLAWFSILEFPRGVIQVSRKVYPHPLLLGFFLE